MIYALLSEYKGMQKINLDDVIGADKEPEVVEEEKHSKYYKEPKKPMKIALGLDNMNKN